jgi:hypothetical protein
MNINLDSIKKGKDICDKNPFYNTLSLLLKYFFINCNDINILDLIRDVTKSEIEFQVFMVYKNYAVDLYFQNKDYFNSKIMSYEDIIYSIISLIKENYDINHKVISPYITSIEENKDELIKNYNYIKSTYSIKKENLNKVIELNHIIQLLEEAKIYEQKSIKNRELALSKLYNLHNSFNKTIENTNIKFLK